MGDRYEFIQKCPNCFNPIHCYYAESCGYTTTKCANCGMEFKIVIDFKLEELHPREVKPEGGSCGCLCLSLRRRLRAMFMGDRSK